MIDTILYIDDGLTRLKKWHHIALTHYYSFIVLNGVNVWILEMGYCGIPWLFGNVNGIWMDSGKTPNHKGYYEHNLLICVYGRYEDTL